ncbi:MAG: cyclic nucleotide-binding protein [Micavibrio aeruginosavorus]|uniref:Cyclic nucleotide-binding protein n=1 Tax=Micavibrio aeruginosavorus TaxID=349221 RepID=A0A2W5Q9M5_9BACT|nr:MAG: cyclic nucleotide-binding protein [Micavibrio aeruginosavorus]
MKRHDTPILERRFIPKDQLILRVGDFGQQAYLVQSGEVSVFLTKEDQELEVARLGPGEIFGEMAVVFDGPRTASVRALTDCNLIVISRQIFEEKLRDSDPTVRAVVHMLSKRVVEANNMIFDKKSELGDLKDTARIIYQNILARLPDNQARTFRNTVLPALEGLFTSLDTFKERYDDQGT